MVLEGLFDDPESLNEDDEEERPRRRTKCQYCDEAKPVHDSARFQMRICDECEEFLEMLWG